MQILFSWMLIPQIAKAVTNTADTWLQRATTAMKEELLFIPERRKCVTKNSNERPEVQLLRDSVSLATCCISSEWLESFWRRY